MSLPILPAREPNGSRTQQGQRISFDGPSSKITGIVTSKKWVLPARPKPGRKPGPESAKRRASLKARANPEGPSNQQMERLRVELERSKHENQELRGMVQELQQGSPPGKDSSSSAHDCGLCDTGGGCVCEELGLKPGNDPARSQALDLALAEFANFSPLKAVPLRKRPPSTRPGTVKRFKRADAKDVSDSSHDVGPQITHVDSNIGDKFDINSEEIKTSPHANPCGFCSSGTPCLCTDTTEEFNSRSVSAPVKPTEIQHDDVSSIERSNIPGSCAQCKTDPMCTLFCTSLATIFSPAKSLGISVTCGQAYQALSRHKRFDACNLEEILEKLECKDGQVGVKGISEVLKWMNLK
jgi:hypothetical protein